MVCRIPECSDSNLLPTKLIVCAEKLRIFIWGFFSWIMKSDIRFRMQQNISRLLVVALLIIVLIELKYISSFLALKPLFTHNTLHSVNTLSVRFSQGRSCVSQRQTKKNRLMKNHHLLWKN